MKLLIVILLVPLYSLAQKNYSNRELKDGKFDRDSSYIYALPFEENKKVFLIQGYETIFSHKGIKALDFKVKNGTRVCAARDGIVVAAREDSEKRGLKQSNLADGNYVSVQHDDGSIANYWHLEKDGVFVAVGDTVARGQVIGLSGNTGYSAFPHLHFEVMDFDENGVFKQVATRFITNKGIRYLKPGTFYRAE